MAQEERRVSSQEERREYDTCRLLEYARAAAQVLESSDPSQVTAQLTDRGGMIVALGARELGVGLGYWAKAVAEHKL